MKNELRDSGFSLVELLVVLLIFTFLAVILTQSLSNSLKSSRKSEASIQIRESLTYALAVMERNIRNSDDIDCTSDTIIYDIAENYYFKFDNTNKRINWKRSLAGEERLTSTNTEISAYTLNCPPGGSGVPESVEISVTGRDPVLTGDEGVSVTLESKILLRIYK